ncbi:MAG: VOC family protein [Deltaproteobacteria bacterium]|nr:VOC family protein [Deltaproteobacteria bacterium]
MIFIVELMVDRNEVEAFRRFEQAAPLIMERHGGVLQRAFARESPASAPLDEVHIVYFPDEEAFARYRADPELGAMQPLRDRAVLSTKISRGIDVPLDPARSTRLLVNIDVPDVQTATRFYTEALGLTVGRRMDSEFVELLGAAVPIYLLAQKAGSPAFGEDNLGRQFKRHWTPQHMDFVVHNVHEAVERAVRAGAVLEQPAHDTPYGLLAVLADPFGHGFCLIEFRGRGYDELV